MGGPADSLLPAPGSCAKFNPVSASQSHPSLLRPDRLEFSRLVWALVASLLLHAACYGIYVSGKRLHLWERIHLPAWVQKLMPPTVLAVAKQPTTPREPPLMFVEVNPANAVVEPPKHAKYYAAQSTRAANPNPEKDTDVPKISGHQEHVMRTEDNQHVPAQPLQPAPTPPKEVKPEPPPEPEKPKPALKPGDLTLAKPQSQEVKSDGEAPKPKPRRLAQVPAYQKQHSPTIGEMARQDGGVRQRNIASSLDAIGSPFGAYDAAIVAAIQNRWYALLDERGYASDRSGQVVVEFRLHYDGRISDLKVVNNTVDEILCLLCQKAILDPSPYARWPSDMRRMVNGDYRDVRFSFYYN